jgi:sarcosine oxidase subunit gamma
VEPLRQALGLGLPFDALTSSTEGDTSFLWLGPDEWMLVTAPEVAEARVRAAREALTGAHHQLVDVSDYYTAIELAGAKARELLMKLTTLDVHARAFRFGMVAGSVFGRANAWLWQTGDDADESGPAFRLFIRWSMADYLWCAMAEAGREWGLAEQVPVKGERLTI